MEDRSIEELIQELRAIKIRENEILTQLEHANRARAHRIDATNHRGVDQHLPPTDGFRQGNRVRIINKVKKPATAGPTWVEARERLATVTRVIPDQIHIVTDNGTKTWRAPNNLRIITPR